MARIDSTSRVLPRTPEVAVQNAVVADVAAPAVETPPLPTEAKADKSAKPADRHQRRDAALAGDKDARDRLHNRPTTGLTTAPTRALKTAVQDPLLKDARELNRALKKGEHQAVFEILERHRGAPAVAKLAAAYGEQNSGADLQKDVKDFGMANPHQSCRAEALVAGDTAKADAARAHAAMSGNGTDEAEVLATVKGKSPAQAQAFEDAFRKEYGKSFRDVLNSEMSVNWSGKAREQVLGALRGDKPDARSQGFGVALGPYTAQGKPDADPAVGLKLQALAAVAWAAPKTLQEQGFQQLGLTAFRAQDLGQTPRLAEPQHQVSTAVAARPATDLNALAAKPSTVAGTAPLSIAELHGAYRAGTTTPTAVAQRFIANVKASDQGPKPLKAFIATHEKDILEQAAASTKRYQEGKPLGPLDGIPVAVKGQLQVKGYGNTGGSGHLGKIPESTDAAVVANVRSQGALVVGTTNMHELGYGQRGENPFFGSARNPYDPDRIAGGSSGGSASAVASGLVVAAIGSDAGGSIRDPAAKNGLVGLLPTHGLLDAGGNLPLAPTLQSSGPMAGTAKDAAILLQGMMGADAKARVDLSRINDTKDLKDVTLGVYKGWNEHADPAVVQSTNALIDGLKARGATIKEIEITGLNEAGLAQMITFSKEVSSFQAADRKGKGKYSDEVKVNLALADGITEADRGRAEQVRAHLAAEMKRVLSEVDGVITPTTAMMTPKVEADASKTGSTNLAELDATSRFQTLANLTGLPAGTFLSGYDPNGMPMGVQVIGRAWGEGDILRIANAAGEMVKRQAPQTRFSLQ